MITVAICDDSLGFPSLVRVWLRDDGRFEVVGTAAGGAELKRLAALTRPKVVLLDLVLPDVADPAELVRELRAGDPAIRVVLLSSLRLEELERAGEAADADAVCSKATTAAELCALLYEVASSADGRVIQKPAP